MDNLIVTLSGVKPDEFLPTDAPAGECGLGSGDGNGVCMSTDSINKVKETLKIAAKTPSSVIEDAKTKTNCATEKCVAKTVGVDLKHFKQTGPANNVDLLNNHNIDTVISNICSVAGNYHMPFQMIDFAGTDRYPATELGNIDIIKDAKDKGFTTMSVVLNTDVRSGGGIHWFPLFISFKNSPITIEYFNSSGNRPVREVNDWMLKTQKHLTSNGHKANIIIPSGLVHQRGDTECGLYSIYYIWNRLNDVPYIRFHNTRVTDKQMVNFRKMCFIEE
jgi:hypothetical protein